MKLLYQVLMTLGVVVAFGGCSSYVTVHYRQILTTARHQGYGGAGGNTYPEDLLVVYDICTIDNRTKKPGQLIFSLQKVGAGLQSSPALPPAAFGDTSFAADAFKGTQSGGLGFTDPESTYGQILVAKGTVVQASRRIVVRVKDGYSDINDTVDFRLVYDRAKGEPAILFVRDKAHEPALRYVEVLNTGDYRPYRLRKPPCKE